MVWTKNDEEKRLCEEWLKEPLINPRTGKAIERNGPTFNIWKKRCKDMGLRTKPLVTKELTWRKYKEWKKNPCINPETGRKIKKNGPTWKRMVKQSKTIKKEIKLFGEWFLPDENGMVPAVKVGKTWYCVRKMKDNDGIRKVYGRLNKKVEKKVQLVYYADTWDYHYNHFHPVFTKKRKPKRPNNSVPVIMKKKKRVNTDKNKGDRKNVAKIFFDTEGEQNQNRAKRSVDTWVNMFIK